MGDVRAPPPPFKPGQDKLWFTRLRDTSISLPYLRALAMGTKCVPHFLTAAQYVNVLGGKPLRKRGRQAATGAIQFYAASEDDMDAGERLALPARPHCKKAKARRAKSAPLAFALTLEKDVLLVLLFLRFLDC